MTKEEAIRRMCKIQGTVQAYLGYGIAADCFCHEGDMPGAYRNDGAAITFIRKAVEEAIAKERKEDGKTSR